MHIIIIVIDIKCLKIMIISNQSLEDLNTYRTSFGTFEKIKLNFGHFFFRKIHVF